MPIILNFILLNKTFLKLWKSSDLKPAQTPWLCGGKITIVRAYPGTLLLVSHDRDLIEVTCNRFMVIHERQWIEFNDIQLAYDYINKANSTTSLVKKNKSNQLNPDSKLNEDKLLERLVEIETLLEKDLQRKPKHQKLDLQKEWLWEIERLQVSLGLKD